MQGAVFLAAKWMLILVHMHQNIIAAAPAHHVSALPAGDAFRSGVPIKNLPRPISDICAIRQGLQEAFGLQSIKVKGGAHRQTYIFIAV